MENKVKKLKYPQLVILVFALVILLGSVLLTLPIASRSGTFTPFIDAVFTAASANCITGLIVYDTYSYWSLFGQIVILLLIQFGGLGFMAIATIISLAVKRKIDPVERVMMRDAIGGSGIKGVVHVTKNLLLGTAIFEGLGAIILAFRFCPLMGFGEGIYNAVFHSVSSFCNAGFDLMGKYGKFSSLTTFSDDPIVYLTLAVLIIIGGIGFLVWDDILVNGIKFKKYTLHTKVVLVTTAALIVSSTAMFYITQANTSMLGMNVGDKLGNALFQAVSPRTAGFNTLDLASMSGPGILLTIFLMFVGGSPGSTAGGIKTTVLFIMLAAAWSMLRGKNNLEVFKRRIDDSLFKKAGTLSILYLSISIIAVSLILMCQDLSLTSVIYEVFSAIGTVGLTLGITTSLNTASKLVIILLMYFGRVGIFSIILAFLRPSKKANVRYPIENINIV